MTDAAAGLRVADHDGVLVVTLDRAPANAMSRPMLRAVASLFHRLTSAGSPPPVVITGAGERFFCAGGDIKELEGTGTDQAEGRIQEFHRMLVAMERYPRPVVAAVNGYCVGGGVEYAMFADVVLAVPQAMFGFPEIRHGLLPAEKGIQRVERLIGMKAARELLLTGELIDAERALVLGLVDVIVEPDALMEGAISRARDAGNKAPVLFAALKRGLNDYDDAEDALWLERSRANLNAYFSDPIAKSLRDRWGGRPR
jgi:enoyl-CoA hydratase/carnithine racemase